MPPFLYILIMKHSRSYYINNLRLFGKFLYYSRIIRLYVDGDATGMLFNYWNPLSYPFILGFLLASILLFGIIETQKTLHRLGLKMNPYFISHPNELYWL